MCPVRPGHAGDEHSSGTGAVTGRTPRRSGSASPPRQVTVSGCRGRRGCLPRITAGLGVRISRLNPPDESDPGDPRLGAKTFTSSANVPDGHSGPVAVNVEAPVARLICSVMVNGTRSQRALRPLLQAERVLRAERTGRPQQASISSSVLPPRRAQRCAQRPRAASATPKGSPGGKSPASRPWPGGILGLTLGSGILRGHWGAPWTWPRASPGSCGAGRGLALMDVRLAGRVASRARQPAGGRSVGGL